MSSSERSSEYEAEPLFTELPTPSQVAVTVVSPMMAPPPRVTPKQLLVHHSADEWEEFVYEWVLALKEGAGYVDVVGMGGSHDGGADIAAFLTEKKTDGPWHCYQCKHYNKAVVPSVAYPEILKIFAAAARKTYRVFPARYVFVAPRIGGSLTQLLARPTELKAAFFKEVEKPNSKLPEGYDPATLHAALELARCTDFSCFEAGNLDVILEQHATTPYHVKRFGTPLPTRPAVPAPPPEHSAGEARYVQQLLDVYGEKWGCSTESPDEARTHPKASRHLQRQREAFYCAEQLRVFARDSVPLGTFESLQKNVLDGVIEVAERDFDTGYDRLNSVLDVARDMPLGSNVLVSVVETNDRKGICHQLANEDQLTWIPEEET